MRWFFVTTFPCRGNGDNLIASAVARKPKAEIPVGIAKASTSF
jgi:hypothetical protein